MHGQNENSLPKENPFINGDRAYTPIPERHAFITFWLIMGMILNGICVLVYMFLISKPITKVKIPPDALMIYVVLCGLNILFCAKLLQYKKNGFYGLIICHLIGYILNLYIGFSLVVSTFGLISIPLLYAIFQIKRNGIPFWKYLK